MPPKKKTELPDTYYKKPEEVHTFAQKYFKDINWETLSKEFNEMGQGKYEINIYKVLNKRVLSEIEQEQKEKQYNINLKVMNIQRMILASITEKKNKTVLISSVLSCGTKQSIGLNACALIHFSHV